MLITNDNKSVTIECRCKCSYLQLMYVGDNEFTLQYYCSYKNKNFKEIEKFNQSLTFDNEDLAAFAESFNLNDYEKGFIKLVTGSEKIKTNYLIDLQPTIGKEKEKDIYSLLVYRIKPKHKLFNRNYKIGKKKLIFEICLDYKQVVEIYNFLNKFKNKNIK
ncbi:hypothetical protein [uncultured Clostridium sp.]|uniref:hypothetical protein n=1 Tax=uncultured Clostridium sp. TaxID=59620 RepID=UPI00262C8E50|nr:hypothetical protein [uncultured Clostridium sp.]